jgi:hypothetical protein
MALSARKAIKTYDLKTLSEGVTKTLGLSGIVKPAQMEIGEGVEGVLKGLTEIKADKSPLLQIEAEGELVLFPATGAIIQAFGAKRGSIASKTTTLDNLTPAIAPYLGKTIRIVKLGTADKARPGERPATMFHVAFLD